MLSLLVVASCQKHKQKQKKSYQILLTEDTTKEINCTIEQDGTTYTVYEGDILEVVLHKGKVNYTLSAQDQQGLPNPSGYVVLEVFEQPYGMSVWSTVGEGDFSKSGSFELE